MANPNLANYHSSMNVMTAPLDRPGNSPRWLIPALLACYLVWGSTYLAIRFALVSFPPYFQMGSRFIVAGMLLMLWMRWRGAAVRSRPHRCSERSVHVAPGRSSMPVSQGRLRGARVSSTPPIASARMTVRRS